MEERDNDASRDIDVICTPVAVMSANAGMIFCSLQVARFQLIVHAFDQSHVPLKLSWPLSIFERWSRNIGVCGYGPVCRRRFVGKVGDYLEVLDDGKVCNYFA